jgi:RNA polymerase sigma factor (sigma-70 family)
MVLRACRAALRDEHDAQDAFQATFLVLARRAPSLGVRDSLAPWLHGVAVRTCAGQRAAAARRRKHEKGAAEAAAARGPGAEDDLASALDEEVRRLPPLYRAPVVLCHLEGRSHDQAARLLGCPVGTVRSRLARGRLRLRERLVGRGLAPVDAGRAAEVPPSTTLALPLKLVEATTRASVVFATGPKAAGAASATAITLAKGVIGMMWLSKMHRLAACVIACGIVAAGGGAWGARSGAPDRTARNVRDLARGAVEAPAPGRPKLALVAADEARRAAGAPARSPAGWGGGGEGYELTRDEAVKHAGRAGGALRSTDDRADGFGTFTQGFRAERYRGKRLRVSAFARTEGVEGWAGLWVRVDGKDKGGLAFDNMQDRPIRGTADWRKCEVVLDVPEEAQDIFFGFLLAGKGQAWVDDFAFELVGKDVAATGLKLEPTDKPDGPAADLPKEPTNLDFER